MHFVHNLVRDFPDEYQIMPGARHSSRKSAFAKASARVSDTTVDGVRACLESAEPVLICSYQTYPSIKYCTMLCLSKFDWSMRGNCILTVRYDFAKRS